MALSVWRAQLLTQQWIAERMNYYVLLGEIVTDASIQTLGHEVGESFRMLLDQRSNESLSRLSQGIFFAAIDRALALQSEHTIS